MEDMQKTDQRNANLTGMIGVGTDHAGVELKNIIVEHLRNKGLPVKDFGANSTESCDYPDISIQLAEAVAAGEVDKGILICATGVGMSISANKVKGIRAALCFSKAVAELSRLHNDANMLVVAGRNQDTEDPVTIVDTWIDTDFSHEERHQRRLEKIKEYEDQHLS